MMARLGPWDGARRVAVAVSGGADSLALALLAADWGDPAAFIVDHGLRPGSGQEAAKTCAALSKRGIPAQILTLTGLQPGPGLPTRARDARYRALEEAAAAAGLVDLLLGHHAGDQAETILMRRRRGSGMRGLAGMAALSEGIMLRRVRPFLTIRPERLRATLRATGLAWVEDPTNQDQTYTRARLRSEIGGALDALLAEAADHAAARTKSDIHSAHILADRATLFPQGFAVLTPGPIEPQALAVLLQAIAGQPFAPSAVAVADLARALRPGTLGGVQILPAGRLGPGWLLIREAAAMAPPVPVRRHVVWDGRVRATGGRIRPGETLGALGADAAEFRHCGLPSAVLRTLPAVRRDGVLCAVELPRYVVRNGSRPEIILRHHASPACGAPFMA